MKEATTNYQYLMLCNVTHLAQLLVIPVARLRWDFIITWLLVEWWLARLVSVGT